MGGANTVGFSDVFFFVQLITGIAFLISGRSVLHPQIINLNINERREFVCAVFPSHLIGPMACFFVKFDVRDYEKLIFALILRISLLVTQSFNYLSACAVIQIFVAIFMCQ